MTDVTQQKTPEHKPRPMVDLLVSILIPSVVLMKFSGEDDLGAAQALVTRRRQPSPRGALWVRPR